MKLPAVPLAVAALALLLSGCEILSPVVCTGEFVYGLQVEAVNAVGGAPVTAGLSGVARDGSYSEPMDAYENRLLGAGERPGTYSVTVQADGFETWTVSGVEVEDGTCHVEDVHLTARLSPLP